MNKPRFDGPVTAECQSSRGDAWELLDDETLAVTVARFTGPRAEATAKYVEALWNAFEAPPYGYHCELVHDKTGEVIRDLFVRGDPLAGPDDVAGFTWRALPVVAIQPGGGQHA